jgi:hypothetical protein
MEPKNRELKEQAYKIYTKAIKSGQLQRGTHCQICGDVPQRIEGHHCDYSRPLDVIWVCGRCHNQMHRFWEKSPHDGRTREYESNATKQRAYRKRRLKEKYAQGDGQRPLLKNGVAHYKDIDWQPTPSQPYACACGCGQSITWAGVGRPKLYAGKQCAWRQNKRKTREVSS